MSSKKSILIIDDHPLFREGLKSIIAGDRHFSVEGEAGDARNGFDLAKKIKPDVALVDISLPDESGMQLTRRIRTALTDTRVMIVSMHSKIDYIVEAFQAGATGYVVKDSAARRLIQGLHAVTKGEYFLDSSISHEVVERLMKSPVREARVSDTDYGRLTPRRKKRHTDIDPRVQPPIGPAIFTFFMRHLRLPGFGDVRTSDNNPLARKTKARLRARLKRADIQRMLDFSINSGHTIFWTFVEAVRQAGDVDQWTSRLRKTERS